MKLMLLFLTKIPQVKAPKIQAIGMYIKRALNSLLFILQCISPLLFNYSFALLLYQLILESQICKKVI